MTFDAFTGEKKVEMGIEKKLLVNTLNSRHKINEKNIWL